MTQYVDLLRTFILSELLEDLDVLPTDANLLDEDMIDSLGMVRLVSHMEEAFGIAVPAEDFVYENFQTLSAIESYLIARQT